jgi:hypothetical protein
MAVSERGARRLCWALAALDLLLGGSAALFPATYLQLVHPHLPPSKYPVEWVVRTGGLWIVFSIVEAIAARSPAAAKWFFTVAILRLMEVPADVVYGVLARGASEASRLAIFIAPVANAAAGMYLLAAARISPAAPQPPGRRET